MWMGHYSLPSVLLGSESAEYHGEHGFAHILGLYMCLLISLCHVQFGPELGMRNVVPNRILFRERCHIFPCVIILLSQIEYSA